MTHCHSLDLKSNYLNCLLYISYHLISKNLVLDQLIISLLIFFFIFFTYLLCIVLILLGEILSWSLVGVKGYISCVSLRNFHKVLVGWGNPGN